MNPTEHPPEITAALAARTLAEAAEDYAREVETQHAGYVDNSDDVTATLLCLTHAAVEFSARCSDHRLSPNGRRVLVALLRYVCQHGNVTAAATGAALLLRKVLGDEADIRHQDRQEAKALAAAFKELQT